MCATEEEKKLREKVLFLPLGDQLKRLHHILKKRGLRRLKLASDDHLASDGVHNQREFKVYRPS
jgi:hypothetical protein